MSTLKLGDGKGRDLLADRLPSWGMKVVQGEVQPVEQKPRKLPKFVLRHRSGERRDVRYRPD